MPKTKITLLSWTQLPLETIYCEWQQSRTIDPVQTPEELRREIAHEFQKNVMAKFGSHDNLGNVEIGPVSSRELNKVPRPPKEKEILEVFEKVVAMRMPLGEHIQFIFLIEHCPILLREQLVRHRIGHKFGDRLGADIIPELAGGSSFWSQTTRIIDMGKFAEEEDYYVPPWLEEHGTDPMPGAYQMMPGYGPPNDQGKVRRGTVLEFYKQQMLWIQAAYRRLTAAGMPLEDARSILPVAMQHRLTWSTNLSALFHVLSRRGCWLAQLGAWEPVIHGIIEELATKIHPTFRRLIDPPCFNSEGNWQGCAFKKENEEIIGKGEYPPCSLWLNKDYQDDPRRGGWQGEPGERSALEMVPGRMPRYNRMMEKYTKLWKRDPRTGERIEVK